MTTNSASISAASGGATDGTLLFVGELQWWTTDADLEAALSEFGKVKEIKFYEEKASGKSKGYCQVLIYFTIRNNNTTFIATATTNTTPNTITGCGPDCGFRFLFSQ